jgi:dihydropteroate synthase
MSALSLRYWQTTRFRLSLSRPLVMGIVNVTPDSFSDGGRHASVQAACAHCEQLVVEGADILDIGGESTRPDAQAPSPQEELTRVLPVLRHAVTLGVAVSLDSSEPVVMRAALDLGVDILNDVRALRRPGALELLAAQASTGACLMHMRGEPATMRAEAERGYIDVRAEVQDFLVERVQACTTQGIARERLAVDLGYGFGKTAAHNLALLDAQEAIGQALGLPVLAGLSRKSLLGQITGRAVDERLAASLAAALAAVARGARIVRVHDVAQTVDALKVWQAVARGDVDPWAALPGAHAPSNTSKCA